MDTKLQTTRQVKVLTANAAAAWAVMLSRPDVISAYPITPATEILDVLYRLHADGLLDCETVEPEGEHSVMSILLGASAAGARTFTATSAQGLFFMYEPYISVANQRLPVVMVNVNREILPPTQVSSSGQDIFLVKDAGWIQLHVETCQEVLDTLIMAFRLAEDPEISCAVTVAFDGYYLSYFAEPVEIPAREEVDRFLPPRQKGIRLDPEEPMSMAPWTATGDMLTEYRVKHMAAMQRSKLKLEEIEKEFQKTFGRNYGGQIEEYRCEDAEVVIVALGSVVGTAKDVIDQKREEGIKVGLIKVRMFRPFPVERIVSALKGRKAIGVIDRNVCHGWNCGHLYLELKFAQSELENQIPMVNFIGGLCGNDITLPQVERVVETVQQVADGKPHQKVTFLDLE